MTIYFFRKNRRKEIHTRKKNRRRDNNRGKKARHASEMGEHLIPFHPNLKNMMNPFVTFAAKKPP